MTGNNLKLTAKIYDSLTKKVKELLKAFNSQTDDKVIQTAQENAKNVVSELIDDVEKEYADLKKNTEWKRFTIAFYGETNAGKSTIIETLRIALKEQAKLKENREFKKLQKKHKLSQNDFDILRQKIMDLRVIIDELEEKITDLKNSDGIELQKKFDYVEELKEKLAKEKATHDSWRWKKANQKTKRTPLEREYEKKFKEVDSLGKKYEKKISSLNTKLSLAKTKCEVLETKEAEQRKLCEVLIPYADGQIIGTGESDFTKKNSIYDFAINNTKFSLIDVPGIEGEEGIVTDAIFEAVQKAHAVFYVTRKPAAPQTGDGKEGTLEKIKRHLGAQTEVWTIFNQGVKNPTRLKRELISDDEKSSLNILHDVISGQLGSEHYRGEIVLSAYPAFLAVSDCLVPGTTQSKSKQKFTAAYGNDELMEITGFQKFIEMLPTMIIGNWQEKIIASNYNKAKVTLDNAIEEIANIQNNTFTSLLESLKINVLDTKTAIDTKEENLRTKFESLKLDLIQDFKNTVRKRIYDEIEDNISNDYFKSRLNSIIDEEQKNLTNKYKKGVQTNLKEFNTAIKKTLQKAEKDMKGIIGANLGNFNGDYTLKINIDNGINTWGAIASIAGGIIAFFTTGGLALVIGIASAVIGFIKSVWSWFSDSYKRSQQREAAEKNIRNVAAQIEKQISESQKSICTEVSKRINEIKLELDKPVQVVKETNEKITEAKVYLENLKKNL